MARRVRGKRSVTTLVDGTTAATSMSCNSDIGRSAVAANEAGCTAERDAEGGALSFLPSRPEPQPGGFALCRTLPAQRLATARIGRQAGRVRCHLARRFQANRRSLYTVLGSPGFQTDPLRQPDTLRFAQHDHHRPSASCGQCIPAVVEHRLRPMIAARSCVSGKARTNTGRDASYVITDVKRLPQRPLPNGRDEALPRPCDG